MLGKPGLYSLDGAAALAWFLVWHRLAAAAIVYTLW